MITVYDANNWVRRQLEAGRSVRECVEEIRLAPAPVIVVWDGPNGNKKRRDLFPGYKAKRKSLPQDMSASFKLTRTLLGHCNVTQIRLPDYEGDDVIAHIATYFADRITLYSKDKDLMAFENIVFAEETKSPCNKKLLRLYKTLVGDSSDNIPGLKGFGQKAWEKLHPFDIVRLKTAFETDTAPTQLTDEALLKRVVDDFDNLRVYWKIIGFFKIPDEIFDAGISQGLDNPTARNEIYQGFLLT